jgi:signal transduction histidine kinase
MRVRKTVYKAYIYNNDKAIKEIAMMIVFAALFVLFCTPSTSLAAPAPAVTAATHVIKVGGDNNYPPYEFIDSDGKPTGFNVELTQAIAEVMGLNVKIRLGKWNDMRQALENGTVDILQGMVSSESRNKIFDFSPPHSIINYAVFGRRGSPQLIDISDLRGKDVLVQNRGIMHDYLIEKKVGANLHLVDTHNEAMRQLAAGKRDFALVGNLPGLYLNRELGLSNITPVGRPIGGQPYGYAVKRGNDEILSQFSEGLAILKNTGRYKVIYDKWLGALEPPPVSWAKIFKYGAISTSPFILVLIGIAVWNRTLRREVASRTEKLQEQQQQLIQADKMASLGILVSGVAHEINNPTGLLLYNLPVLKNVYQVSEALLEERFRQEGDFMIRGLRYSQIRGEIPRMIEEMQDGANRIKRIVEDLKDFARQDNSKLDETVSLNNIVKAAIRLVDNSIKNATNHFTVEYGEHLPAFKGNSQRVEQVIVNLVLNACQSLLNQNKGIRLSTRYDMENEELLLRVQDEGVGIEEENLPQITNPFFTTKRDSGGTGLGLSVSDTIIKEHNGRMTFESAPGEGTTVCVYFPAMKG